MKDETYVPWSLRVVPDKVLVSRWSLLLGVAREHTLETDAHALYVMHWTPPLSVEEVEADDAVRIDVRMPRYGVRLVFHEDYFRSLAGVRTL